MITVVVSILNLYIFLRFLSLGEAGFDSLAKLAGGPRMRVPHLPGGS